MPRSGNNEEYAYLQGDAPNDTPTPVFDEILADFIEKDVYAEIDYSMYDVEANKMVVDLD